MRKSVFLLLVFLSCAYAKPRKVDFIFSKKGSQEKILKALSIDEQYKVEGTSYYRIPNPNQAMLGYEVKNFVGCTEENKILWLKAQLDVKSDQMNPLDRFVRYFGRRYETISNLDKIVEGNPKDRHLTYKWKRPNGRMISLTYSRNSTITKSHKTVDIKRDITSGYSLEVSYDKSLSSYRGKVEENGGLIKLDLVPGVGEDLLSRTASYSYNTSFDLVNSDYLKIELYDLNDVQKFALKGAANLVEYYKSSESPLLEFDKMIKKLKAHPKGYQYFKEFIIGKLKDDKPLYLNAVALVHCIRTVSEYEVNGEKRVRYYYIEPEKFDPSCLTLTRKKALKNPPKEPLKKDDKRFSKNQKIERSIMLVSYDFTLIGLDKNKDIAYLVRDDVGEVKLSLKELFARVNIVGYFKD